MKIKQITEAGHVNQFKITIELDSERVRRLAEKHRLPLKDVQDALHNLCYEALMSNSMVDEWLENWEVE